MLQNDVYSNELNKKALPKQNPKMFLSWLDDIKE